MATQPTTSPDPRSSPLVPPITREQLEENLLTVFSYFVHATRMLIGEDSAASGFVHKTLPPSEDLSAGAEDLDLTFADIAHMDFVQAFVWMYDFAYFGHFHADADLMGDESSYTRAAAFVFDVQHATLPVQMLQDAAPLAAERLTEVAETANARHILEEGNEAFFHFRRAGDADGGGYDINLTVRQLALLAGMTEMTIRTLANPKRTDGVKTITVDGRTRIESKVAREWLQRKGKYVPVRRVWSGGDIDVATARLFFLDDLTTLLNRRFEQLADETPGGATALRKRFEAAKPPLPVIDTINGLYLDVGHAHFTDPKAVAALATILDLPARAIALRARELIAQGELKQVQRDLEALKQTTTK